MKKAFTLAEVLITLGIIGVVAALTLPNLLQNHAKKVLDASQKVATNEMSSAAAMAMIDNNATIFQESDGFTNRDLFQKYVKISRRCEDSYSNCFGAERYVDEENQAVDILDYIASDSECAVSQKGYAACYNSEVGVLDLNGDRGPNKLGADIFGLVIDSSGTANVVSAEALTGDLKLDYSACGKIKAIKAYRAVCGLGLKESKDAIDNNSSKLSCPDKSKNKQLKAELIAAGCTVSGGSSGGGNGNNSENSSPKEIKLSDLNSCGGKIPAIKVVKEVCGMGLKEAKEAVESGSVSCSDSSKNSDLESGLKGLGCSIN